jgi:PKD repeat protein
VRWDWDNDGYFDTEYSYDKIIEHQFEEADSYTVTMEVINSKGWTDQEFKVVNVYADSVPPTASFTVSPDTSGIGTIFLFNSAGSSDPHTAVGQLKFRWDWQSDGKWDTPFSSDTNIFHKYTVAGEFRILMEVRNNVFLTDTTSRTILVYDF